MMIVRSPSLQALETRRSLFSLSGRARRARERPIPRISRTTMSLSTSGGAAADVAPPSASQLECINQAILDAQSFDEAMRLEAALRRGDFAFFEDYHRTGGARERKRALSRSAKAAGAGPQTTLIPTPSPRWSTPGAA